MAIKASEEQVLYAKILNAGMLLGLGALIIAFIIYCASILSPIIPLEKVQTYWILSV
ncbi:MAG: DUF1634 domain-containing protein, partial [Ignavibacteriaceae bacterium]|nr:DUF1634 domain-containing protein [Ignavibacteriaceae bacterium]